MKIVILTNAYPYLPGEQFIEDEIGYWATCAGVSVTLLPALAAGTPRPIPAGISIDLGMARSTKLGRLWFMLLALCSAILRRELGYLHRSRKTSPHTVARALLHTSKVLEQAAQLRRYARAHGPADVAYCYWNETQAYAAVLARDAGAVRRVVSRVHGFDLYEARRRDGYMPLKRQFIAAYDAIFALSSEARAYLQQTYGAAPGNVRIAPLGVPLADGLARPSATGHLHVVSVSFCLRVKRLDKIVGAVALLGRRHPEISLTWTHIGGGPLLEEITALAKAQLNGLKNIVCAFLGELPNHAVKVYYLDTPVDMLINASESEGVPVSIMEAMSAGVPAVAPDVGGISSLVSDRCGALLGPCPDVQEIAEAMERVAFADGRDARRAHARQTIEAGFDAARNYRDFVADVIAIGASGDRQPAPPLRPAAYRIRQATRR
ncbi:glycosyltransferase [Rhodanobacter hydrolyticus]|uniref:Glycosyltransferase n=1 Tax=Rhodanobacter hydrolyticus TaxID=2250595 RepID=A0ABW8J235_9GAMM